MSFLALDSYEDVVLESVAQDEFVWKYRDHGRTSPHVDEASSPDRVSLSSLTTNEHNEPLNMNNNPLLFPKTSSMVTGWTIGYEEVVNITFPILIIFALLPFISIGATLMSPLASQLDAEGTQMCTLNHQSTKTNLVQMIPCNHRRWH